MSRAYGAISCAYDCLNGGVDYTAWADFAERCFDTFLPCRPSLVLDLACGTGTLTDILAHRGYDMTGVDASPEMLSVARERCCEDTLLLCQNMCAFELYGTVGATICSLDSLNHLTRSGELEKCLSLVHNYLDPDGLFIFDVNSAHRFEVEYAKESYQLEGELDDGRMVFCNWQNNYSKKRGICRFYLTLFTETAAESGIYARSDEEWSERYYNREELTAALENAGFEVLGVFGNTAMRAPRKNDSKLYFVARAKK